MNALRWFCLALLIVVLGVVLSGCSKQVEKEAPVDTGVPVTFEEKENATREEAPQPVVVEVELGEFYIKPSVIKAEEGEVTLLVKNKGNYYHEFEVEGLSEKGEAFKAIIPDGIESGGSAELNLNLSRGSYKVYCPIPGHEEKGMVAELVVG